MEDCELEIGRAHLHLNLEYLSQLSIVVFRLPRGFGKLFRGENPAFARHNFIIFLYFVSTIVPVLCEIYQVRMHDQYYNIFMSRERQSKTTATHVSADQFRGLVSEEQLEEIVEVSISSEQAVALCNGCMAIGMCKSVVATFNDNGQEHEMVGTRQFRVDEACKLQPNIVNGVIKKGWRGR